MSSPLKPKRSTLKKLKAEIDEIKNQKISKGSIVYFGITLLATATIAISTYLNYVTTKGMLSQMEEQTLQTDTAIKIQSDYYQKTNRPFVYVESLSYSSDILNKDSNVIISFNLKNVGALPAKDVRSGSWLRETKEMISKVDTTYFVYNSSIFPDQGVKSNSSIGPIPLELFKKSPYILVYIGYSDFGEKHYYFQQLYVVEINETDQRLELADPKIIWTDFN